MNNQQPTQPQNYQQPPQSTKKKLKTWQIVLIVIGAILVLGALANAGDSSKEKEKVQVKFLPPLKKSSLLPLCQYLKQTMKQLIIYWFIIINQNTKGRMLKFVDR